MDIRNFGEKSVDRGQGQDRERWACALKDEGLAQMATTDARTPAGRRPGAREGDHARAFAFADPARSRRHDRDEGEAARVRTSRSSSRRRARADCTTAGVVVARSCATSRLVHRLFDEVAPRAGRPSGRVHADPEARPPSRRRRADGDPRAGRRAARRVSRVPRTSRSAGPRAGALRRRRRGRSCARPRPRSRPRPRRAEMASRPRSSRHWTPMLRAGSPSRTPLAEAARERRTHEVTSCSASSSPTTARTSPGSRSSRTSGRCRACLEDALGAIVQRPVRVRGAGRTDAGVHALGQVVSLDDAGWTSIPDDRDARDADRCLPSDVAVVDAQLGPEGFDARSRAVAQLRVPAVVPRGAEPALRPLRRLDAATASTTRCSPQRCSRVVGTHDFTSFGRLRDDQTPMRRVIEADRRRRRPASSASAITGESFLHQMVRSLVGTALEVADGTQARLPGCATLLEAQ